LRGIVGLSAEIGHYILHSRVTDIGVFLFEIFIPK